jgi:hypothetical protein
MTSERQYYLAELNHYDIINMGIFDGDPAWLTISDIVSHLTQDFEDKYGAQIDELLSGDKTQFSCEFTNSKSVCMAALAGRVMITVRHEDNAITFIGEHGKIVENGLSVQSFYGPLVKIIDMLRELPDKLPLVLGKVSII